MLSSVETLGFANWELCAMIRPPSRLGTIPYRALVPRLSAGMASVMTQDWHRIGGLAWDWPIGLGLADWHGLAQIGTDWQRFIDKFTLDWHQIGTRLVLDWLELAKNGSV